MSALAEVVGALEPELARHARRPESGAALTNGGGDRAFVIEAVREGYLLHYGEPRIFGELDEDLRLLAGDSLYALALSRLAQQGDLEAVAELSDLISLSARAHAESRPGLAVELWRASAGRLSGEAEGGAAACWRARA